MEPKDIDYDGWLMKNVAWMVQETSQYFDTRELLSLCQTVAVIRLYQTLRDLLPGQDLAAVKQALGEQAAALAAQPPGRPAGKKSAK